MELENRNAHTWIIGQPQTGKTNTLLNLAIEDIYNDLPVMYLDPYGHSSLQLLSHIPEERKKDVIFFDATDFDRPIGFNILNQLTPDEIPFVASFLRDTIKGIWSFGNTSTATMDLYIRNSVAALSYLRGGSLFGMYYMLTSKRYRTKVIGYIKDPVLLSFWKEFENLPEKDQRQEVASTKNKAFALIDDPRLRHIIAQRTPKFNINDVVKGKILIVRLPISSLGTMVPSILGSLLLAAVHFASMNNDLVFRVHVDGLHEFSDFTLIQMLTQPTSATLTLTNQYTSQLPPEMLNALISSAGNKIAYRLGIADSRQLKDAFFVKDMDIGLHELDQYDAYVLEGSRSHRGQSEQISLTDTTEDLKLYRNLTHRSYSAHRHHVQDQIDEFMREYGARKNRTIRKDT